MNKLSFKTMEIVLIILVTVCCVALMIGGLWVHNLKAFALGFITPIIFLCCLAK